MEERSSQTAVAFHDLAPSQEANWPFITRGLLELSSNTLHASGEPLEEIVLIVFALCIFLLGYRVRRLPGMHVEISPAVRLSIATNCL